MSLFEGYGQSYGAYKITGEVDKGKILGKAYSLKGPVTLELWHDHLMGKQGLGIVPINQESKVKFAAIDIDQYPLELTALNKNIYDNKLPLVVCRTKSGGAHLYCFMTDWVDAGAAQRKMREFAAFLGFGDSEIFPKQTKIIVERGDIGQWINMPYFNVTRTDRFAIGLHGKKIDLEEFVNEATRKRLTPQELVDFKIGNFEVLIGGPPCLNLLCSGGFPPGTRNNGLFNLAVYCKKKSPDNWQPLLEDMNQRYMDPPLTSSEVLGVIKSVSKKDFQYMCEQAPIKQFCNKTLCRTCVHGIGGISNGFPKFGTLTKLCTQPAIWFLELEGGGRLELSTDDLQSPAKFQNRCMESLNIMPPLLKRENWMDIVQKLLLDVTEVDVPIEATPKGQMLSHLEAFCNSKIQGKTHDELLLGKPWLNNKRHFFRMMDFLDYLERRKFRMFNLSQIAVYVTELGATKHFFNVRGKGVNCYSIPEFETTQTEPFEVPEQEKPTPY